MGVKQEAAPPSLETDTGNTDKELKGRGRGIRRGESPPSEGSDKRNRRESWRKYRTTSIWHLFGAQATPCHTWNQPGRDLKSGTTLKWAAAEQGEVFALFPTYNNNTSSMMRHYRGKHENEAGGAAVMTFPPGEKQELDEALVDFIVKDSQPFTVVSDPGFRALVAKLDPTCTLPSRQTVKAMVERRDVEEKEKAKAALQNVDSVSLSADMWTSINMDAYLAVTCHAIHAVIDPWKLLDRDAEEARASRNATADAIVEVQRYLSAPPLERSQDPLVYWTTNKALYPNLYHLANQYLATPASSVPCERVFSKAGEIVSKREKPPQTLDCEKLLFLNKNA
ncbi:hypothetical protein D4764_18G0003190 [Takifugu flavidus]|uniref:HAT C-terminal dimerisation domain-containing protein n=1 Tax=Takifugu flavidus TaxID=433684 RepID=A0A5C6NQJ5_9TELE|nr:hypothetical protein D4764_18G0003190 [Takifugu flavidus]